MPHTPIHIATQKKPLTKKNTHPFTTLDRMVLIVSVLYPFSALPQVIAVFSGKIEGVSVLSWMVFLVCTSLFLIYGIRRSVLPMIVSNSIWIVMDTLVIVGILTAGSTVTWI